LTVPAPKFRPCSFPSARALPVSCFATAAPQVFIRRKFPLFGSAFRFQRDHAARFSSSYSVIRTGPRFGLPWSLARAVGFGLVLAFIRRRKIFCFALLGFHDRFFLHRVFPVATNQERLARVSLFRAQSFGCLPAGGIADQDCPCSFQSLVLLKPSD
jgi:hypothetical protein